MGKTFSELEIYLEKFGYKKNEMLNGGEFQLPQKTAYEYLVDNTAAYRSNRCMNFMMNNLSGRVLSFW